MLLVITSVLSNYYVAPSRSPVITHRDSTFKSLGSLRVRDRVIGSPRERQDWTPLVLLRFILSEDLYLQSRV